MVPIWRGTSLESPITKVAIPLVAAVGSEFYPSGTACIIAPWLAITARHVVEDHFERFLGRRPNNTDEASHITVTYVASGGGQPVIPLFVQRTWYLEPYDIAVLYFPDSSRATADNIANIAFIVGDVNKSIGQTGPEVYLKRIDPRVIKSQCIPADDSLWAISRARDFWAARRELLAESFNEFLGDSLPQRRLGSS